MSNSPADVGASDPGGGRNGLADQYHDEVTARDRFISDTARIRDGDSGLEL